MADKTLPSTTSGPAVAGQPERYVGRPLEKRDGTVERLWSRLKQRLCKHRFAIEDLEMVNPDSDGNDRVRWPCDKCGEVFHAQCGLWISPGNGFLYRRHKTPNVGSNRPWPQQEQR